MAINERFTDYELNIIHLALDQVFSTGKTDVVCPRCGGKLIGNRASSAYGKR